MRKVSVRSREVVAQMNHVAPNRDAHTVQERTYRLLTPMIGGGVISKTPDLEHPFRESSIKGQLRFWWRATRGNCVDIGDLRRRESMLFGSTDENIGQSRLKISVLSFSNLELEAKQNLQLPQYVSFPLDDEDELVLPGAEFRLRLVFPKAETDEYMTAMKAWEIFGGLGARTRRGFGALELIEVDAQPAGTIDSQHFISDFVKKLPLESHAHREVPRLSTELSNYRLTAIGKDPTVVWDHLVKQLEAFRQSPRAPSSGQYRGQSHWPEAASIRDIVGTSDPTRTSQSPIGNRFPRAQLGLPVQFKFKDRGDPPDKYTVKGTRFERMASPLIIKPIICSDGPRGLALVLERDRIPPGGLKMERTSVDSLLLTSDLSQIRPMSGGTETDVPRAFLNSI